MTHYQTELLKLLDYNKQLGYTKIEIDIDELEELIRALQ